MAVGENDLMTAGACACSDARTGASEARPSGEARPCAGVPGEACSCAPPSGEARPCALEVASLDLSWDGAAVCRDISFRVETGEVVCLVGRSGSGKTTLFHAIAGLTRPDAGRVLLGGEDITGRPGRVSYMLQKDLLLPYRTIEDNVALPLLIKGEKEKAARQKAAPYFAQFGLEGTQKKYPHQLSGGQCQRVAIARALALTPDILCFDEPTSALDPELTGEVLKVIRELAEKQTTMIIVTHEMAFARDVANHVIFMDDGCILEQGDPHEVIEHPKEERTKQFLSRFTQG